MKKIFKLALAVFTACMTAFVMSICVSAETEDVELPTQLAKATNGAWGQSIFYDKSQFDCSRITPDTIISIEYTTEGELKNTAGYAAELIFQNYSTADPQIWAKVAPYEFTDTTASYKYDDIIAAYGSEDLSTVDNLCVGDCGVILTVTKVTLTNCEKPEETTVATTEATTTTTEATTTEKVTTTAETEAETTAATTKAAEKEKKNDGGIPIVLIVVITVVVAVAVVVTILVIKSKRRFY